MWKVSVIPDADDPVGWFALVMSMSHLAGDAFIPRCTGPELRLVPLRLRVPTDIVNLWTQLRLVGHSS
jgi:hypothetical protein